MFTSLDILAHIDAKPLNNSANSVSFLKNQNQKKYDFIPVHLYFYFTFLYYLITFNYTYNIVNIKALPVSVNLLFNYDKNFPLANHSTEFYNWKEFYKNITNCNSIFGLKKTLQILQRVACV